MMNFIILVAAIVCAMVLYSVAFLMLFFNKHVLKLYLKKTMKISKELVEESEDYFDL